MCLGTWNVHNLGTKDGLSRLVALSHFIHYHGVGVLAVQETRLHPHTPLAAVAGLQYFGSAPVLQPRANSRYCRGTGFLVPTAHRGSFAYLGPRSPLVDGYGAVWARWQGSSRAQPVFLASVYCPDTGAQQRHARLLQDVYEQISAGCTYYSSKPGMVCLMGDWNAHVPASSHMSVPAHLHHLAPAVGIGAPNSAGRALLDFCSTHGLRVVCQHVNRPSDACTR
jgi:exonuclease III